MLVAPSRSVRRDVRHTMSLIEPHLLPTDSVLDVGCGSGYVTHAIGTSCEAWGIDVVDSRRTDLGNFHLFDGLTIDFPDQRFDVVILAFVLHHVPNELKPRLLGEARRVCRRKLLVLEDTPRNAIDRYFNRRHGEKFRRSIGSTADFGFYSRTEWEGVFDAAELDVVESRPLGRFCRDPLQPYARSFFVTQPRAVARA
jgi:SAM-dependent methyltransferase